MTQFLSWANRLHNSVPMSYFQKVPRSDNLRHGRSIPIWSLSCDTNCISTVLSYLFRHVRKPNKGLKKGGLSQAPAKTWQVSPRGYIEEFNREESTRLAYREIVVAGSCLRPAYMTLFKYPYSNIPIKFSIDRVHIIHVPHREGKWHTIPENTLVEVSIQVELMHKTACPHPKDNLHGEHTILDYTTCTQIYIEHTCQ